MRKPFYVVGIDSRTKPPESYHVVTRDEIDSTIAGLCERHGVKKSGVYVTGPVPAAWAEAKQGERKGISLA